MRLRFLDVISTIKITEIPTYMTLNYIQQKELAALYNTELQILCDVITPTLRL